MKHPFEICATPFCCCCFNLSSYSTCSLIATICIVVNGFSGLANIGVGHWAFYFLTIFSLLLHILAGVILLLGTILSKSSLKVAYCWLTLLAVFVVVASLVVYIFLHKSGYLIWGEKCGFSERTSFIYIGVHAAWLLIWDVCTPMIVLGNLYDDESQCSSAA